MIRYLCECCLERPTINHVGVLLSFMVVALLFAGAILVAESIKNILNAGKTN